MINNWWVTRPKRKLTSVPEVLAVVATDALNKGWEGDRKLHLKVEEGLEVSGLKREGDRRDQGGGGGRTQRITRGKFVQRGRVGDDMAGRRRMLGAKLAV